MLAYDFPVLGAFVTMIWFFLWVMWLFLLFRTLGDILRSQDMSGATKVAWMVCVFFLPYLGVFAYVLLRGDGMARREQDRHERAEEAFRAHVRAVQAGPSEELARLAALRDQGILTDAEFQQEKAKLLA